MLESMQNKSAVASSEMQKPQMSKALYYNRDIGFDQKGETPLIIVKPQQITMHRKADTVKDKLITVVPTKLTSNAMLNMTTTASFHGGKLMNTQENANDLAG